MITSEMRERYGTLGVGTILQMDSLLAQESLQLVHSSDNREFIILNSRDQSVERIQEIFGKGRYFGWRPIVLSGSDREGNRRVKLTELGTEETAEMAEMMMEQLRGKSGW